MDLCVRFRLMPTVNTVVQNKSRMPNVSIQCASFETSSLCWVNLRKFVVNNKTSITSRKLGKFCIKRGVRHIRWASYYSATNQDAEFIIQVFKRALRANSESTSYSTSFTSTSKFDSKCDVHRFLKRYCTIPPLYDQSLPFKLLYNWTIRTTLNLIRPQIQRQVLGLQLCSVQNYDRTNRERVYNMNQKVFVRQYLGLWKLAVGQILRRSRPLFYKFNIGDKVYFRHASQLL